MADIDNNGTLSFGEAQAAASNLTQAIFDQIDTNNDGELSQSELEAATVVQPPGCACPNQGKALEEWKDIAGDAFLIGMAILTMLAWSRVACWRNQT